MLTILKKDKPNLQQFHIDNVLNSLLKFKNPIILFSGSMLSKINIQLYD